MVVIEKFTVTSEAAEISRRRPASRETSVDLVVIDRWSPGTARTASANLLENSPNTRCWLHRSISCRLAMSQNTVVPPLPRATS